MSTAIGELSDVNDYEVSFIIVHPIEALFNDRPVMGLLLVDRVFPVIGLDLYENDARFLVSYLTFDKFNLPTWLTDLLASWF